MESKIPHRFVNLTTLLSQKMIGKNLVVQDVFWTPLKMIVRCQYNFTTQESNPLAKNRYVKGVNTFMGADKMVFKVAYF